MSYILNIETSTKVCSVTLCDNEKVLMERINLSSNNHAELLGVYVKEITDGLYKEGKKPNAIAVSAGPGSYTGLRIGLSEAKGLCYGFDIPLIALSSLEIMAAEVINAGYKADCYCPMIDARRMEVYAVVYNNYFKKVKEVHAEIINDDSYQEFLDNGRVLFFGDGSEKCKPVLTSPNASFIENIYPLAKNMAVLSYEKFKAGDFVDTAYFEPNYLKEFYTTAAKKKVI